MNGRTGEETFQYVDVQLSFIIIIIRELRFSPKMRFSSLVY